MPGFSSFDDFINETTTNGKRQILPFYRTINTGATSAAGAWHECFASVGTGGTGTFTGTAGVGVAMTSATTGALPISPAVVSTDLRYLTKIVAQVAATTAVPGWVMLTDMLYQYPSCVVTGTPTVLSNAAGKPARHNSGIGAELSAIVNGANGAATPLLTCTYTNTVPTAGRTGTLASTLASSPVGRMYGGAAAGGVLTTPIMGRAAGDLGVNELNSYAITSGGTTGTVTFLIHRPITTIPLIAANAPSFENYIGDIMPQIDDNACLGLFVNIGGALPANQVLQGELRMGWG
jgi:hypothetical protein